MFGEIIHFLFALDREPKHAVGVEYAANIYSMTTTFGDTFYYFDDVYAGDHATFGFQIPDLITTGNIVPRNNSNVIRVGVVHIHPCGPGTCCNPTTISPGDKIFASIYGIRIYAYYHDGIGVGQVISWP